MFIKNAAYRVPVLATFLLFASASVSAQSLMITDCQGFTRAARVVKPNTLNTVEAEISNIIPGNLPEGAQVSLTNEVTGEVIQGVIKGGTATFENVNGGVYALSTSENLTVGKVTISGGLAGKAESSAAVLGLGALIGGGAVAAVQIADNGNDDEEAAPVPTEEPEPTAAPGPTAGPRPTRTGAPSRPNPTPTPNDCPICDPDITPPPIKSPFPDELPARRERSKPSSPSNMREKLSPYS